MKKERKCSHSLGDTGCNRGKLCTYTHRDERKCVLFYKEGETNPEGEIRFYRSSGEYGFLSNLYKTRVAFEDFQFRSSEDAYQYGKPRKKEVADWLIAAPSPHLCAAAAHSLFAFDINPEWNKTKINRMKNVLRAKFSQHEDLKRKLIETYPKELIEDSNIDAFWGIGKNGDGKNMLGKLLMEVREELMKDHGIEHINDKEVILKGE